MAAQDKGPATNIRKGNVIIYQNVPHIITDVEHRTQGRQAGFIQVTLRNLITGISTQNKYHSNDMVFFCFVESKSLEYSYEDDAGFHFMNTDTYDDEVVPAKLLDGQRGYLIPGTSYSLLFVDGNPVQLQLPASIEMTVSEAFEGLRGDTASNAQKPVTVETGMRVQVPLFIKTGDKIRISTADCSYLGRA
jgi:elongation factor P